jgi:hypothetical protein
VAPATSAVADFEFVISGSDGPILLADGAYMAIIPKNFDIDLSEASGAVDTDQIEPEAATEIMVAEDATADTYDAGDGLQEYLTLSGGALDADSLLVAQASFQAVNSVPSTISSVLMLLEWDTGTQASEIIEVVDQTTQSYMVQKQFSGLPSGKAWELNLRVSASGSADITIRRTRMQVEVIKR